MVVRSQAPQRKRASVRRHGLRFYHMGLEEMRAISIITFVAVLSTQCHAQDGPNAGQCEQVRAAIAEHGLQAARKHAAEHYGLTPADLRRVEQECGIDNRRRRTKKHSAG